MSIVFLNGSFIPIEQATISVLDRGFLLGDGVYEVIPCYRSKLFRLEEHLHRFRESMRSIRIENPYDDAQWMDIFEKLIDRNGGGNFSLYVQVTRGIAPRDHAFPNGVKPTVVVMANRLPEKDESITNIGASVITINDDRWLHCNIKAISLLANVLARQQAVEANSSEAILIRDEYVMEGAASNVFIVNKNQLVTPPKSQFILGGITRDLVIEIAEQHEINTVQRSISRAELFNADEVWLTSSIREIIPVTSIDGKTIGNGMPGPLWRKMTQYFSEFKSQLN